MSYAKEEDGVYTIPGAVLRHDQREYLERLAAEGDLLLEYQNLSLVWDAPSNLFDNPRFISERLKHEYKSFLRFQIMRNNYLYALLKKISFISVEKVAAAVYQEMRLGSSAKNGAFDLRKELCIRYPEMVYDPGEILDEIMSSEINNMSVQSESIKNLEDYASILCFKDLIENEETRIKEQILSDFNFVEDFAMKEKVTFTLTDFVLLLFGITTSNFAWDLKREPFYGRYAQYDFLEMLDRIRKWRSEEFSYGLKRVLAE
eukprot:TRINITY_DN6980_c0_g1_i4.p1 TRINITY_DN6980_c0_g1~~TRINITY_DN6980_c0_g1_i4.p1  ORF type:complete len:260 (-),score=30.12 TRINITY_DN6980_c0_g1_i4:103-882(-)